MAQHGVRMHSAGEGSEGQGLPSLPACQPALGPPGLKEAGEDRKRLRGCSGGSSQPLGPPFAWG